MHYFKFNIGEYASHTRHLSPLEDIAYRRLLDLAYTSELPLIKDIRQLTRLINMREHEIEVQDILREFFFKTDEGWLNNRVIKEMADFKALQKKHWASNLPAHIKTSMQAKRNASKVNATPQWLNKSQRKDIANIYAESALITAKTGIKHEVDHIVPLRSKVVCGLHVAWNLQVIEGYKNRVKNNYFEVA